MVPPCGPGAPGVLSQLLPVSRPRLTQPDSAVPFPRRGPGRREAVRPSWSLSWWHFLGRDPQGAGLQMVRLRCSPWTPGSKEDPWGGSRSSESCLRRELSVRRKEWPRARQLTCAAARTLLVRDLPSVPAPRPSPILSLPPGVCPGAGPPAPLPGRQGQLLWGCVRFWEQILRHSWVVPGPGALAPGGRLTSGEGPRGLGGSTQIST